MNKAYAMCKSCKHFDGFYGWCLAYKKIVTRAINLPHHCIGYIEEDYKSE